MQAPAAINQARFERILEECFPGPDAVLDDDATAVIERMYEDFVLFDLHRAVNVEIEQLLPFFRDPEAEGSLWGNIRPAACTDGATHVAFARIFCEDLQPVLAILYWNGSRIALAVPEEGNLINPGTRAPFGRDETDARALSALIESREIGKVRDHYDYGEALEKLEAAGRFAGYDLSRISTWAKARLGIDILPFRSAKGL